MSYIYIKYIIFEKLLLSLFFFTFVYILPKINKITAKRKIVVF